MSGHENIDGHSHSDIKLKLRASVRIFPPHEANDSNWNVIDLISGKRFVVSEVGVIVLLSFSSGVLMSDAIEFVREELNVSKMDLELAIKDFLEADFIFPSDKPDVGQDFAIELHSQWSRYNWNEAYDYHIATFDYPFLDYSDQKEFESDSLIMKRYYSISPDLNRTKSFPVILKSLIAPPPKEVLSSLGQSFGDHLAGIHSASKLDAELILKLFSASFGKLRERANKERSAPPLLRKTSPSGGARHPTEAYLFSRSLKGMDAGIYHFNVEKNALDMIKDSLPSIEDLKKIFAGPYWAQFNPMAFVIFSSVFERNMYRYREPRTFRTIYLDVGHLCCTFETIAAALGVRVFLQHGVNDQAIENLLGINYLEEGVLFAGAIGEWDRTG